jgi:hypothetical protein
MSADEARLVRRMLQALDAYWRHYEGVTPKKRPDGTERYPRGRYDGLEWWAKFELYRAKVEAALAGETAE